MHFSSGVAPPSLHRSRKPLLRMKHLAQALLPRPDLDTLAEARRASDLRDLELINRHADVLNAEAEDVLGYQADL